MATTTKTYTINDLTTDSRGAIKNTQANRSRVEKCEVENSGVGGWGTNSYHYTDFKMGDYIVRMTSFDIEVMAVKSAEGYVSA